MTREDMMRLALRQAEEAFAAGEVPVGCVIADAEGKPETYPILGQARLEDCTLCVTLEPCPMCAGAIINARVGTVVYGAKEANFGSCGSVINLFEERYGHHPKLYGGVLAEDCAALLTNFFAGLR